MAIGDNQAKTDEQNLTTAALINKTRIGELDQRNALDGFFSKNEHGIDKASGLTKETDEERRTKLLNDLKAQINSSGFGFSASRKQNVLASIEDAVKDMQQGASPEQLVADMDKLKAEMAAPLTKEDEEKGKQRDEEARKIEAALFAALSFEAHTMMAEQLKEQQVQSQSGSLKKSTKGLTSLGKLSHLDLSHLDFHLPALETVHKHATHLANKNVHHEKHIKETGAHPVVNAKTDHPHTDHPVAKKVSSQAKENVNHVANGVKTKIDHPVDVSDSKLQHPLPVAHAKPHVDNKQKSPGHN